LPPRRLRWIAALVTVAIVPAGLLLYRSRNARVPLLTSAVVIAEHGRLSPLAPGDHTAVFPGTRLLQRPDLAGAARDQAAWLRAGRVPTAAGRYADMVAAALLDLRTLTLPNGASLAGWPQSWRYVWPRDAAFAAVALARTGHTEDALAVLRYLQLVQGADGAFQARYLPDGSGRVPDGRGEETDGLGWALWAAEQIVLAAPAANRPAVAAPLATLVTRSLGRILALTSSPSVLPPPSLDYWEIRDDRLSLGTAAPLALGLRSAVTLTGFLGQSGKEAAGRADALQGAIDARFGPGGYPRYAGDEAMDASVAFLLPPFRASCDAAVLTAWQRATGTMTRPAGGVAPGAGWKQDGISWTPETALFALTAAATGRRATAEQYLDWLDRHRTDRGALAEKVLSDGQPAGPAPLGWTAALVVLAVDSLGHPAAPTCA
jgi:GH15 family glucan-1,4-alpha-glucosidase